MSNHNAQNLEDWFRTFEHRMNAEVPSIISRTAIEYFKGSFTRKSWEGVPWKPSKNNMVDTASLIGSIEEAYSSPDKVTIRAGSSKVPYAKIHNEGGTVTRKPRSETFQRKRYSSGKQKGKFKGGITSGQGFTFKETSFQMPKRQFMGYSPELNIQIAKRLIGHFKK